MKLSRIIFSALLVGLSLIGISCSSVDAFSPEFQEKAPLADVSKKFESTKTAENLYKDVLAWSAENNAGGVQNANLKTEKNEKISIDCTNVFVTDTSSGISTSDVTSEMHFIIEIYFKDGEVVFSARDVEITPKVMCVYIKSLFGTKENKTNLYWGTIKHAEGKNVDYAAKIRTDGSALYMNCVNAFLKGIEAISAS